MYANPDATGAIAVGDDLADLYDADGNRIATGDVLTFSGTAPDGTTALGPFAFTVGTTGSTVQELMTWLDGQFDAEAEPLGADLTTLKTAGNANDAIPAIIHDAAGAPILNAGANLAGSYDSTGNYIADGDVFTFSGTDEAGAGVGPINFTIGTDGNTVQDLIDWLADLYDDGDPTNGSGLPGAGNLQLAFNGATGEIDITDATGGNVVEIILDSTTGAGALDVALNGGQIEFTDASGNMAIGLVTTVSDGVLDVALNVGTGAIDFADSSGNISVTLAETTSGQLDVDFSAGAITFADNSGNAVIDLGSTTSGVLDLTLNAGGGFDVADTSTFVSIALESTISGALTTALNGNGQITFSNPAGNVDIDLDSTVSGALTLDLTAGAIAITDASGSAVITLDSTVSAYGSGSGSFQVIEADLTEDGSQMGNVVAYNFEREALTSTQYANSSTTIYQDQDGFAAGFLQAVNVNTRGIITGSYSNGQVLQKAKVALANFSNVQGLHKVGGNIFRATTDSGAPVTGAPGENGLGSIAPNSLEMSNVDLGTEFVKLITTQRGFQANSKIITTTDEMLNELINIKR